MALVIIVPGGAVTIAVPISIMILVVAVMVAHPRAVRMAAVFLHLTRRYIAISPSGFLAFVPAGGTPRVVVPIMIAISVTIMIVVTVMGAVAIIAMSVAPAVALARK